MQIKQSARLALTGCLLVSTAMAVRADVRVVQTTTLVNAHYAQIRDSMTANQKAAAHRSGIDFLMGVPKVTTIYVSGQHLRVDGDGHYDLYNNAARTETTVDKANKSYTTVSTAGTITRPGAFQTTVVPTKKHSVILGHPATAYLVTATSVSFPGIVVSGEVWCADDINQLNLPADPMSRFSSLLKQFKGLPLVANLKVTGMSSGESDLRTKVTSISQASLPASTFRVPPGYTVNSNPQPINPLAGLGGGM